MLDAFLPHPRSVEVDHADVAAPPDRAYAAARDLDLRQSPLIAALFALRTLPERLRGAPAPGSMKVGDIGGPAADPGFRTLAEAAGEGFVVGAIARPWEPDITYADVAPEAFEAFAEPGWAKIVWSLSFVPRGEHGTRIVLELRLDATDDDAWAKLRRYFRLIGPFSHFIRRHALAMLRRELGDPQAQLESLSLPGDALVAEPKAQATHAIDTAATPAEIWPWLVQMGCDRGGWYSYDRLDNAGEPSKDEIVPELQTLAVGDVLPGRPGEEEGFFVQAIEPGRALVLGGTFDRDTGRASPADAPSPESYWRATWAFVLEPLDESTTRLYARARADFAGPGGRWHALWVRPVHHLMQTEQLKNLKHRAEGKHRVPHETWTDIGEGLLGAAGIAFDLVTPFLRPLRSRWGLDRELAERMHPGDERIPKPRWSWTHGVEIDAPPEAVWPWVAQIGQGRGGFYTYQWLENLVGCDIQNADAIEERWQHPRVGDGIRIHPAAPPLAIVGIEPGRYLLLAAESGEGDHALAVTWLFYVEDRTGGRSRLISRYRVDYGEALAMRLQYGPTLLEPVGFVMDRRMLLGIKERAEGRAAAQDRGST